MTTQTLSEFIGLPACCIDEEKNLLYTFTGKHVDKKNIVSLLNDAECDKYITTDELRVLSSLAVDNNKRLLTAYDQYTKDVVNHSITFETTWNRFISTVKHIVLDAYEGKLDNYKQRTFQLSSLNSAEIISKIKTAYGSLDDFIDVDFEPMDEIFTELTDLIDNEDPAQFIAEMAIVHICLKTEIGSRFLKEFSCRRVLAAVLEDIRQPVEPCTNPVLRHMRSHVRQWKDTFFNMMIEREDFWGEL